MKVLSKIKTAQLFHIFLLLLILLLALNAKSLSAKFVSIRSSQVSDGLALQMEEDCTKSTKTEVSRNYCYSEKLVTITKENNPDLGFQVLKSLQKIDITALGCHLLSHGIGWGAYQQDPGNWRGLMQTLNPACGWGAIHGVLEGYVNSLPDKTLKKETVPTICGDKPTGDCIHILGHLLLVQTEDSIPKALDMCTVFTEQSQKGNCFNGVFMENETALNLIQHGLASTSSQRWSFRFPEIEKLCRTYSGAESDACWREFSHVIIAKFNNDPKKVIDYCGRAPGKVGARNCRLHAVNILMASFHYDIMKYKYMCTLARESDPGFEGECYPDIVYGVLAANTYPEILAQVVTFCDSLDDKFKPSCFSRMGYSAKYGGVKKDDLVQACKLVDEAYRNLCLAPNNSFNSNTNPNPND